MFAMPSHAISCTPIPPWSSSKCRNTPSTNQLDVFAFQVGRSVWLNKDYCLNTSSSSKFFRQGGNGWNLFDFDNQSAAFFCVDTIKYYSIPSVPSGLEGVKTRPQRSSPFNDTYPYWYDRIVVASFSRFLAKYEVHLSFRLFFVVLAGLVCTGSGLDRASNASWRGLRGW